MKEIYWRIFLNTKKKARAEKLSATIIDVLKNCKKVKLEVYWKDDNLYCLELKQNIKNTVSRAIVYELLENISALSNSWKLELPEDFNNDENFEFSGICDDNIKLDNLTWISFMLQDKDISVLDIV